MAIASRSYLANLPLADPGFAIPGPIYMILGADVYGSLLVGAIKDEDRQTRPSLNKRHSTGSSLGLLIPMPLSLGKLPLPYAPP